MDLELDTPVQFVKGVGPKLGELLSSRGLRTVGELIEYYPRAYEDRRAARSVVSLEPGMIVSLGARVLDVRSMPLGRSHRKIYEVVVGDSTGRIACKYFRVPYKGYFARFHPGMKVRVSGKVTEYRGRREFHHPDIHEETQEAELQDLIIPIYTETEGLKATKLRSIIGNALKKTPSGEGEIFPPWLRKDFNLIPRGEALREIHIPPQDQLDDFIHFRSPAQRRIIFEEFFWIELQMALKRQGFQRQKAKAFCGEGPRRKALLGVLPFQLTGGQTVALNEILEDLAKPHPMHRLVQGDVGSGKTMVAFLSALQVVDEGSQVALMVPTEILAEQHYASAKKWLEPLGVRVELFVGQARKKGAEEALARGEIDLAIGTHALIQEDIEFKNLDLVIIDEQHRFGVEQRVILKQKGVSPHFLIMTATPIPRTLAMTVYGDLDVSSIRELPPGRMPVLTRRVFQSQREKVFHFMRDEVKKGRQAYVIYPLVEESEALDLKNALEEFERLKSAHPDLRFGLLHGRMRPAEKDEVMGAFRRHEVDVLVSTTVVEVGVDVPNATLMVIEHCERFGLSQLHQLRGRVGRGSFKSYCVLVLGHAFSEEALRRAEVLVEHTDGFKVAEADLEIRGPGEFLGTRQSGLPGFRMAHLVRDLDILMEARRAAFELLKRDPLLVAPEHGVLKAHFQRIQRETQG